jgi:hypothetical protein
MMVDIRQGTISTSLPMLPTIRQRNVQACLKPHGTAHIRGQNNDLNAWHTQALNAGDANFKAWDVFVPGEVEA